MKKLYKIYLDERKLTTQVRLTRQAKISRDVGSRAVKVAKTQNDTLYKRMMYHLELYKKFKKKLIDKYSSRVKVKARM